MDLNLFIKRQAALMKSLALIYEQALQEYVPAREYLIRRGLDSLKGDYSLGYSPEGTSTAQKLLSYGFTPKELLESKMFIRQGDSFIDRFSNRLMFPIFSPSNEVVAFCGRTIGNSQYKYLLSSDSTIFNKATSLYLLNKAFNDIILSDVVFITEGSLDAIALHESGIKNTVAILGTTATFPQLSFLAAIASKVVLILDSDSAGVKGAEKIVEKAAQIGLETKTLCLPDNLDPFEFYQKFGSQALSSFISDKL